MALKTFTGMNEQYAAGRYVLKALGEAFNRMGATQLAFNSDILQKIFSKRELAATKALGSEGYDALAGAIFRGQGPGLRDVFTPTGALAKISEMIPLPGPAYARMRIGTPELVGNPLSLSPMARTGLDLGVQGATQPLTEWAGSKIPPITLQP